MATKPRATAAAPTQQQIVDIITQAANRYGIPPDVLLAVAQTESGLNPNAVGDQGSSFGLFQEHKGGELTTVANADNPAYAANLAAQTISAAKQQNPSMNWGQAAAAAQRPANEVAYAQAVNGLIGSGGAPIAGLAQGGRMAGESAPPAPTPNSGSASPGSLTVGAAEPGAGGVNASGNLQGAQPSTTNQAPMAGVDLKNFYGYDLTAIPQDELGNTEYAITEYIKDPNLQAKINQDMQENFGYQSWATKVPQLNAVLIAAATQGWNENTFIGAVTATQWWKQTNQNQRAWQQMQGDDPSTAHELLTQSKERVLATANQLGVTLTAKQLDAIGNYVASGTATQSGVLGAVSGTLQEQIDQQVVYAATGNKGTGIQYAPGLSSNGDINASTAGGTNPDNLFGTSEYLYDQFKQIAQNYMLYSNSPSSPLNDSALMSHVESAMQNFTGSNSFGNSNLEQGAIAKFTEYAQQQAASLYPSMATAITKLGVTPATYVQPVQNLIANTLGENAQGIDLTDPKWNWAIAVPPGGTTAPTQDQILQKLVTMPEYDQSNNAVSNAKSITSGLSQMFGLGGQ